ncbi:MAG TPA: regulatory protein RecX [Candidatus Omnitrophota bacterium]|nr:regulatory protein RecX [Candidatus Omnitrophota bacterium]
MKRKKFPAGVIDATVRFLKEKQFLDDGRFSRAWIDSRLKRSIGLRRVKNELRLKGIPSALAEASAAAVTEGYDENEIVQGLISRKTATMKGIDRQKMKQRIYAFLVRRGFSADAIMDNLNKTFRDES